LRERRKSASIRADASLFPRVLFGKPLREPGNIGDKRLKAATTAATGGME
jgi:hypothetical protein